MRLFRMGSMFRAVVWRDSLGMTIDTKLGFREAGPGLSGR
jgi:hypothetical protein